MSTTKINLPRGDSLDIPFTIKVDGVVPGDVAAGTVTFALNAIGSTANVIEKSASPTGAGVATIVLLEADTKLLSNDGSYEYEFRYVNGNVRKSVRGKWDSLKSLLAPTV